MGTSHVFPAPVNQPAHTMIERLRHWSIRTRLVVAFAMLLALVALQAGSSALGSHKLDGLITQLSGEHRAWRARA